MTRALLAAAIAALAAGCTQVSDRVVLLPDADGRTGALRVQSARGELDLKTAYASAEVRDGAPSAGLTTAAEVDRRYGQVLARKPRAAVSHTVHFVSGRNVLTPASQAVLERIRAEVAAAPATDVVVIGHTDRVGSVEANDRLSLDRAKAVGDALIEAGVPRSAVSLAGRGEREPLVATDDEVAEPRNRRVEVRVR